MKPRINNAKAFSGFRKVFGVRSYIKVPELSGFDSGYVSRMRSGKSPISCKFFLAVCLAADMSPNDMCQATGIPPSYFFPE